MPCQHNRFISTNICSLLRFGRSCFWRICTSCTTAVSKINNPIAATSMNTCLPYLPCFVRHPLKQPATAEQPQAAVHSTYFERHCGSWSPPRHKCVVRAYASVCVCFKTDRPIRHRKSQATGNAHRNSSPLPFSPFLVADRMHPSPPPMLFSRLPPSFCRPILVSSASSLSCGAFPLHNTCLFFLALIVCPSTPAFGIAFTGSDPVGIRSSFTACDTWLHPTVVGDYRSIYTKVDRAGTDLRNVKDWSSSTGPAHHRSRQAWKDACVPPMTGASQKDEYMNEWPDKRALSWGSLCC